MRHHWVVLYAAAMYDFVLALLPAECILNVSSTSSRGRGLLVDPRVFPVFVGGSFFANDLSADGALVFLVSVVVCAAELCRSKNDANMLSDMKFYV